MASGTLSVVGLMLVATHRPNAAPVDLQRQHSFETALLGKPVNGNPSRGAYLNLISYAHSPCVAGAAASVASDGSMRAGISLILVAPFSRRAQRLGRIDPCHLQGRVDLFQFRTEVEFSRLALCADHLVIVDHQHVPREQERINQRGFAFGLVDEYVGFHGDLLGRRCS
jgi:hypothetical protein